jgi:arylsulfatase A-like enzyme
LVEAIDLVPTFVEYCGGARKPHVVEGRSLMPLLHGGPPAEWRQYAFSEYDYAMLEARLILNQPIDDCRLYMVFDDRWKLVHAKGFRPMRGLCPRPAVRSGILIGYWDEVELAEARAVAA